ncbi:MAG: hypothetical protein R6U84_03785 [Candidatus Cloacimonadales bacterium]
MKNILLIILVLFAVNAFASFDDLEPSPRARAMGGTHYANGNDVYSTLYNPAGLAGSQQGFAISYVDRYGLGFSEVTTVAMSMKLPRKYGTLGFSMLAHNVEYNNVNLTSETTYAVAHGFTLMEDLHSSLKFGYTANIYYLSFSGMGDEVSYGLNLGAQATLHQRTKIGFAITNINNPNVGKDNTHDLPQKLAVGFSYEPYDKVITSLEMKQTLGEDTLETGTEIHAGTEFQILEPLALRFGLSNLPVTYSMGASFNLFNMVLDYAFSTHATLGSTHQFGLGYSY